MRYFIPLPVFTCFFFKKKKYCNYYSNYKLQTSNCIIKLHFYVTYIYIPNVPKNAPLCFYNCPKRPKLSSNGKFIIWTIITFSHINIRRFHSFQPIHKFLNEFWSQDYSGNSFFLPSWITSSMFKMWVNRVSKNGRKNANRRKTQKKMKFQMACRRILSIFAIIQLSKKNLL